MANESDLSRDDLRDLYSALRSQWAERNQEYDRARRLYRGDHWNAEDNPAPRNRYTLIANYLKPIADKDVQILMGQLPGIQMLPPSADAEGRAFAERLEGLLYGNWAYNDAHSVFLNVAWNSVVLRRGFIAYWWDAEKGHFRFNSATPDNFYPIYDGGEIVECIYVSRRLTRSLKRAYAELADDIESDNGMDHVYDTASGWSGVSGGITDALGDSGGSSRPMGGGSLGYTTVLDYYDNRGNWTRVMGEAVHKQKLGYPVTDVPFVEVVNSIQGEEREPVNSIDQLAGLNMYYDQVLSQRADVIKKWSNPPIIDRGSGVAAATIKTVFSGDGGVLPINPRGDLAAFTWQGNMPEIAEQMAEVKEAIYDLSGKPRSAFGQTITNQSGVMTNLALTPTLQSNEMREMLWGAALIKLNRACLMLYEEFSKGKDIHFRGTRMGKTPKNKVPFDVTIKGRDVNGWYENRIKWPSAVRVDDPAFVQTELAKLQSTPQAQSIYDTLENLGVEDVEAYIDRIKAEHEDVRIHPEIMAQAIQSLATLGTAGAAGMPGMPPGAPPPVMPPGGLEGAMPPGAPPGLDAGAFNAGMRSSGETTTAQE